MSSERKTGFSSIKIRRLSADRRECVQILFVMGAGRNLCIERCFHRLYHEPVEIVGMTDAMIIDKESGSMQVQYEQSI